MSKNTISNDYTHECDINIYICIECNIFEASSVWEVRNYVVVNNSNHLSFSISCYGKECPKNLSVKEPSKVPSQVQTHKEVTNSGDDSNKSHSDNIETSNEILASSSTPRTSITISTTKSSQSTVLDNNSEVKVPQKLPAILPKNVVTDSFLTRFRNHNRANYADMRDYQTREVYLFVINFHHTKYGGASFIRNEIYRLFAYKYPYDFDLFLIGPKENSHLKIYGNRLFSKGYYAYHSMRVAIDLFPPEAGYTYAGYFEANDDSCLQPTLLGEENHNKAMSEVWFRWKNIRRWRWNYILNKKKIRFNKAYLSAVSEIESNPSLHSLCKFNSSQLRRGWGDFFYFPKSNLTAFLELESVMYKHYVFLENAVPFIMNCFDANVIKDCNHGKMPDREVCPHLHPVKFSRLSERQICLNRIMNITLLEMPNISWCICLLKIFGELD